VDKKKNGLEDDSVRGSGSENSELEKSALEESVLEEKLTKG